VTANGGVQPETIYERAQPADGHGPFITDQVGPRLQDEGAVTTTPSSRVSRRGPTPTASSPWPSRSSAWDPPLSMRDALDPRTR